MCRQYGASGGKPYIIHSHAERFRLKIMVPHTLRMDKRIKHADNVIKLNIIIIHQKSHMVMTIIIIVLYLIYNIVNARGNTFRCAAISNIFLQCNFLLVAFYLFIDNIL